MRIVAMTNEGQLPMMKNMLNTALKAGFPMDMFHCYILNTHKEAAKYNTAEFHNVTLKKLEVILENMRIDSEVFWIDNDIVLFDNCIAHLRSLRGDFVMQDDIWGPCTGFFLVRTTPNSIRIMEKTIHWLRDRPGTPYNDQHAFVRCYKPKFGLASYVTLLSQDLYPNGDVYFNQNRKSGAKMVHCNYLTTTAEKVERFKGCGLWDDSDTGFDSVVNKYMV
jgi:hypothetical protein